MNKSTENTYKYYRLGLNNPVRVAFNSTGLSLGTQSINSKTGDFVWNQIPLSRIETSPDVEEISESDFDHLCEETLKKKNTELKIPPP